MTESEFLKVAEHAAEEAGRIISGYAGNLSLQKYSGGSDITTQADYEAEAKILEVITVSYPTHNIISEEKGRIDNHSDYTWIIDPLDGTVSFVSGIPNFAVSIGLLKGNQPILGVVNRVAEGELYFAEQGIGAYLNGNKISVSRTEKLESAFLGLEFGYKERVEDINRFFIPLIDKVRYPYILGGVASSMALLAKGTLDCYAHRAKIWDFAAGVVLVSEGGGNSTDPKGQPINWLAGDWIEVVASNGLIHNEILEALKR